MDGPLARLGLWESKDPTGVWDKEMSLEIVIRWFSLGKSLWGLNPPLGRL